MGKPLSAFEAMIVENFQLICLVLQSRVFFWSPFQGIHMVYPSLPFVLQSALHIQTRLNYP